MSLAVFLSEVFYVWLAYSYCCTGIELLVKLDFTAEFSAYFRARI
jgi:hypothetical protein